MTDFTTLGPYLRRERECRGLALRTISENTKVSLALLEGLETDDISRWPGGIFRRAFVRAYAQSVGLDADDVVRRFDRQFPNGAEGNEPTERVNGMNHPLVVPAFSRPASVTDVPARARLLGTAADLTVAVVLAFGCAAAGSRLLWPVLLIAVYYALGVLITGTSPMVALLTSSPVPAPPAKRPLPARPESRPPLAASEPTARSIARHAARRVDEGAVGQRSGMQAPI